MFGLSVFAEELLGGIAICTCIFFAGFGLEWHLRNGDDAQATLKQERAVSAEVIRQSGIAMAEAKAGADAVNAISASYAQTQQSQNDKTNKLIASIPKLIPKYAPTAPQKPMEAAPNASPESPPIVVYGVPNALVRLHDAAASGASDPSAISIPPGESNGSPSNIDLSQFTSVLVGNYGVCRSNADQLTALQLWAITVQDWYAKLVSSLQSGQTH